MSAIDKYFPPSEAEMQLRTGYVAYLSIFRAWRQTNPEVYLPMPTCIAMELSKLTLRRPYTLAAPWRECTFDEFCKLRAHEYDSFTYEIGLEVGFDLRDKPRKIYWPDIRLKP